MKILFVSPELEEKSRGIKVILNNLISSVASLEEHEIGLLAGYPYAKNFKQSQSIDEKLQHRHLQDYLTNGRKSFKHILNTGGYSKLNILKSLLTLDLLRSSEHKTNSKLILDGNSSAKKTNFFIQSPFFYQFFVRNFNPFSRFLLRRICKKHQINCVIFAAPSHIRKEDLPKGVKVVHFVHDLMPIEIHETPPYDQTPLKFARQIYHTIEGSDLLLANSKDTKNKILEIEPEAKVSVLYGTASQEKPLISETKVLEDLKIKKDQYMLFASAVEKRKNIENLLDAYEKIYQETGLKLVVVGGKGFGIKDIKAKHASLKKELRENIIFTGYVSEEDKYTLFNNCNMFVFPSVYEGLGLVIIEAMLNKKPILTTKLGALPEVGGDAVLYVDNPYDINEIAEKTIRLYGDKELRKQLVDNSAKQVSKFSYEKFEKRFQKAFASIS